MDRFDEMRLFARIVEMRSLGRAADAVGMPASTASDAVRRLEARLGVRLLDRTTRVVVPTRDGEAWYAECLRIVGDVEDAEASIRGGKPAGRLRVESHGSIIRHFLLPRLPAFLAANPAIELVLSEGDRLVDLAREGVDCAVRVGTPEDSGLVARPLGALREAVVAAPAYLARHGTPATPDDLGAHRMVAFLSAQGPMPLYFAEGGRLTTRSAPVALQTTAGDTMARAALLGLGLVQVPRYRLADDLAAGRLVEVLAAYAPPPSPVNALYPRDRAASPRVRAFLDWLGGIDFDA